MSRLTTSSRCPYSIDLLLATERESTYVIREKDNYGEYPNIYAHVYYRIPTHDPVVVVLSDTGTGLNVQNIDDTKPTTQIDAIDSTVSHEPAHWNIATFLEHTLNTGHQIPYVVLTSHCHYDHIMGIGSLQKAGADLTIYASSHSKDFLVPWSNLQKHSLAESLGLKAPKYDARWIDDAQILPYIDRSTGERHETSITVIHTPGHTPDSLSWYDRHTNVLSVGDMIYEQESDWTRSGSNGKWAREPPQPIIFNQASNIVDWNASLHRLIDFVRRENRRLGTDSAEADEKLTYRQTGFGTKVDYREDAQSEENWSVISSVPARRRVALSAAHVTVAADAEFALLDCLAFMLRIQLDQVPRKLVRKDELGGVWLWDDALSGERRTENELTSDSVYRFSVRAPWSIIHRGSGMKQPGSVDDVADKAETASFRSVIRQTITSEPRAMRPALKSAPVATVSHGNVMAHRN